MSIPNFSAGSAVALRNVPRLPGVPVLGVLPQLGRDPLNFFLNAGLYHDIVRLDLGNRRMILVSHPEYVKYVLQDNNRNFRKGYNLAKPLLGNGLVTSEGEEWLRQRRLMQPAFSNAELASLSGDMAELTVQLVERWHNRDDPDRPLDMAAEMMGLTQAIILRTMFGADIGEESGIVAQAFATTLEYLNVILLRPFSFTDKLPTPTNRRFHRALGTLEEVIERIIMERRRSGVEKDDLLGKLLSARDEQSGEGMSDRQLRDEVMTIFLAGHETTATLLAWTWYSLSKDPLVDRLVRAEVENILGGRMAGFDDLPSLIYTRMVLDEALRLYPPAWMFARQAIEDDQVGGYHLPAGSFLMFSPFITHRLPQFWENPEGFDPERFSPERSAERPRFSYFPFGGGPRQCIGNNFALTEALIILTTIVQHFRLELVPGRAVRPTPVATLRPKPGVWMTVKPL